MRVFGPVRVVADWEEDRKRGASSWEETWNLAAFYMQMGQPVSSLEVLSPGVTALAAPFSHLRFALYSAVQALEHPSAAQDGRDQAIAFLTTHLLMLPLPTCYLGWLLLTDDAAVKVDLIRQAQTMGVFQELVVTPVTIPPPEGRVDETVMDSFREDLQKRLRLENTWRVWINDFAERHRTAERAWQRLSEALERAKDIEGAERALRHILDVKITDLNRQSNQSEPNRRPRPGRDGASWDPMRPLRSHMIRLFEYYRRVDVPANAPRAAFKGYSRQLPQLWDAADTANNLLIGLTRAYIDEDPPPPPPIRREAGGSAASGAWTSLFPELAAVGSVAALRLLRPRVDASIDLIGGGQKTVRERAAFIKQLTGDICSLDGTQFRQEELENQVIEINRRVQAANSFVDEEAALRPAKALTAAIQRVFEAFTDSLKLRPVPVFGQIPVGPGLPDDLRDSSLLLYVKNNGPGDISDLLVVCESTDIVASKKPVRINMIAERSESIVAIPVASKPQVPGTELDCKLSIEYRWGVVKGIRSEQKVTAKWFSFRDFLSQHGLNSYELPRPYTDGPIDFSKDSKGDARQFQGRESELDLIRSTLVKGKALGSPLYLHGIRKIGKTSLLNRIVLELTQESIPSAVIDLHFIRPEQSFEQVVNSFTQRLLTDCSSGGFDVAGLEPIPVDHGNPIAAVEPFFRQLRERVPGSNCVLLLDEFQLLVSHRNTALLDLLRRIYNSDMFWFVFCGWMRPEPMRKACVETQLFPLQNRAIDFLPKASLAAALRVPVAQYGVEIPDATVQHVYEQTAGNPFHMALLGLSGIDCAFHPS